MKCDACGLPMGCPNSNPSFWCDKGDGQGPVWLDTPLCDECATLLGLIP